MPRPRRRKNVNRDSHRRITCPVCDAETIEVEIDKQTADLLMINPGPKFVCIGKFIYRTNASDLQFAKCYGIPSEFAMKALQNHFSPVDIIAVVDNLPEHHVEHVKSQDPFFKNVLKYIIKEEEQEVDVVAEQLNSLSQELEEDAKQYMNEVDDDD